MTKRRAPVSIENTLYRVLGELGIERAAEVTGRSESHLRALTDPDKRERLTVEDGIKLDLACAVAIGRAAQTVNFENAEAVAALMAIALDPTSDPKLREHALRQAEEAHEAYGDTIQLLRAAGPGGPSP